MIVIRILIFLVYYMILFEIQFVTASFDKKFSAWEEEGCRRRQLVLTTAKLLLSRMRE
jgi:hypothetical protein